jgi:hypothetical protein
MVQLDMWSFTIHKCMHFAFDLHDRMECLFSELVSYFNLKMKIAKPLRMILLAHIITDPEVAESIAARRAVPFCEELGFHSVVFEGDSLNAVNALNSHTPCWRTCGSTVEDTRDRLLQLHTWSVQYVRREANQVAHFLTKHALSVNQDVVWKEECPYFL